MSLRASSVLDGALRGRAGVGPLLSSTAPARVRIQPMPMMSRAVVRGEGLRRAWASRFHGLLDQRFVVFGVAFVDADRRFHPCIYVGSALGAEEINWGAPVASLNRAKAVVLSWLRDMRLLGPEPFESLPESSDGAGAGEGEDE